MKVGQVAIGAGAPRAGKSTPGVCRLCLKTAKLHRSHVVPELAYRRAYDPHHRILEISRGTRSPRPVQEGIRERLLCGSCEAHLNQWESYFSRIWYRQVPTRIELSRRELSILVDYARFKLFHLSVLWRMSVASVRGFDHFHLERDDEERIRQLLLASDPGSVDYFRITGALMLSPDSLSPCHGVIMGPSAGDIRGSRIWHMLLAACAWIYLPVGAGFPEYDGWALDAGGRMRLRAYELQRYTPADTFFREKVAAVAAARLPNSLT